MVLGNFRLKSYVTFALLLCSILFFAFDVALDIVEHIHTGQAYSASALTHLVFEMLACGLLVYSISLLLEDLRDSDEKVVEAIATIDNYKAGAQKLLSSKFDDWGLSEAEQDISLFILKGLSTNEIADLRGVTPGTTKNQITAIFKKVGVSSRTELLSILIQEMFDFSGLRKYE
jgi:DNA-binding CsgD family transcriptional regulator